jgi:thiamine kinase-like enzyme
MNMVPLLAEIDRMGDLERRLVQRLLARQGDFERTMRKMPVNGTMIVIHGDPRPANWIISDGQGSEIGGWWRPNQCFHSRNSGGS